MRTVIGLNLRPLARILGAVAAAGLLAHAGAAAAIGLNEAFDAALVNDPAYQGAVFENAAGQENRVLGRVGLLPSVNASVSASKNRADVTANQTIKTHPVYFSRGANLQVRQSLFNLDAVARYKQGIAQSEYSDAVFASRLQELVLRLVGAYADAAFSVDQVRLAEAQRATYVEQKKVNDRLFKLGEGTRTDVLETQARLDLSEAQLIEARDLQSNALVTLSAIVGREVKSVDLLRPEFQTGAAPAGGLEQLLADAVARNPEVQARTYAVEVARQEVNKARAGHAPRLDLVASVAKSDAETINTFNQESRVRNIGFQLNIPLYAGGQVSAVTRQAAAGYEKTKADLQATKDKVLTDLRKQYALVLSSAARIGALDKAVASGQLLMQATEQSIKGGVRINLDLLNAQQQLYTSERDRAQARHGYLLSVLRLRAAAGTLEPADVAEVAAYFR